jgi:7,8-dihydro-6-hydroxymethylpterin-pyrophosphokinase
LHERRFVLEPLVELDRDLEVPGRGSVQVLLAKLDSVG